MPTEELFWVDKNMAVFDFKAIKSYEEIGPVSHKRYIGTLHCKSDHAARLRMKYEMMHLAHTLGGLFPSSQARKPAHREAR